MPHFAVRQGHIKRVTDEDIQSSVLEISSVNISNTFITCPADPSKTLGIKLPFLVMIVKNQKKYFSFEVYLAVAFSCECYKKARCTCSSSWCMFSAHTASTFRPGAAVICCVQQKQLHLHYTVAADTSGGVLLVLATGTSS
jgi:hypothetical protein